MVEQESETEYSFARMDANRARWTVPEIYAPPADLSRYLDVFFVTRGMSSRSADERGRRMPEGASYIVLLAGRAPSRSSAADAVLVAGGAQERVHEIPTWSYAFQCGVRIRPGACGAVLGIAASAIRNAIVPLRELWGTRAERLLELLAAAKTGRECVELLSEAVRSQLCERAEADLLAVRFARAIRDAQGNARLAALARECGTTVRTLERRFEAGIGLSPKQYQRITRIARVFDGVGKEKRGWAELALDCGYYDQSHLVEDCHRLLGRSPDQFLRRLTNVASLEIGLIFEKESAGS